MFCEQQSSILKDHVTLKTGLMNTALNHGYKLHFQILSNGKTDILDISQFNCFTVFLIIRDLSK